MRMQLAYDLACPGAEREGKIKVKRYEGPELSIR
jgi:hypothetical protein